MGYAVLPCSDQISLWFKIIFIQHLCSFKFGASYTVKFGILRFALSIYCT